MHVQVGRALLRFMRPRAFTGPDSQDSEEADDSEPEAREESSLPTDDANKRVQLTSAKIHDGSPSTAPVDHIYELNKADVDDPKDSVRQSGSGQYELFRTFVHGLEYVNELVMMADNHSAHFILQDANYNVIALVDDPAYADFMTDYDPYGQMRLRVNEAGAPWIAHEYDPNDPRVFSVVPGFQGGTQDRETGLICFGARCYDPDLGRWLQTDPNGTGLVLGNALRYHAQTPSAHTNIAFRQQYRDGLNLYAPFHCNPTIERDPTGLITFNGVLSTAATGLKLYGWYSNAKSAVEMARALRDGASLRNVMMDFAINVASDYAFGKALDILASAAAPLANKFAQRFRQGIRKTEEELEDIRLRAHEKPLQDHHFVPRGEKRFVNEYNRTLGKYGMDVNSPELPVINMPHQGRHATEYMEWIQETLVDADSYANGNKEMFLAFLDNMAEFVQNAPEVLMKDFYRD